MGEEDNTPPKPAGLFFNANEHVRLRPGMYFGSIDERGLYQALFNVLDDSMEEVLHGHCDHIWLTLLPNDAVRVRDNSRGLPVHTFTDGKSLLEHIMTERGTRRVDGEYKVMGGSIGVGLGAVNAVSSEFIVEVARDGYLWQQTYREGTAQTEVLQVRSLSEDETTGTTITFRPDFAIFEQNSFSYEKVSERLRELAYLLPGLTTTLLDERQEPPRKDQFFFQHRLADYIGDLNQGYRVLHEPHFGSCEWTIRPTGKREYTVSVDLVFQYADTMETRIISYVNTTRIYGGFHHDIMPFALERKINESRSIWARSEPPFTPEEILPGLTAIIIFKHPNPYLWLGRNREVLLLNSELAGITIEVVNDPALWYGEHQREASKGILEKCLANREALKLS